MTLSNAGKIGGSAAAGIGLPTSIYFAYEYSTSLYEVEKEVIEKNVKFDIDLDFAEKNIIKIEAATTEENSEKLDSGHSWVCTITVDSISVSPSFVIRLRENLFTDRSSSVYESKKRENKELLVKACAKNRIGPSSNVSVRANIFAKEIIEEGKKIFLFRDEKLNVLAAKNMQSN